MPIKEYIDYDPMGTYELNQWIEGNTSLMDFQMYILDCFRAQLESDEYAKAKFVLWERHPMEALKVFSTTLDDENKDKLERMINELCEFYDIPSFEEGSTFNAIKLSTYDLTPECIADVIYNELLRGLSGGAPEECFVYLYMPNQYIDLQQQRIMKRGRPSEMKKYRDLDELKKVNDRYVEFANKFLDGDTVDGDEIWLIQRLVKLVFLFNGTTTATSLQNTRTANDSTISDVINDRVNCSNVDIHKLNGN